MKVARTVFGFTVVTKLLMWGLIVFGLYLAGRALIDGHIGWGLLIVFIIIPVALWAATWILGLTQMLLLYPLAILLGRRREMTEVTNFTVAVAEQLGANTMSLRAGWVVMHMFEELPPREPNQPTRSGPELVELWEELHADDDRENEQDEPSPSEAG